MIIPPNLTLIEPIHVKAEKIPKLPEISISDEIKDDPKQSKK